MLRLYQTLIYNPICYSERWCAVSGCSAPASPAAATAAPAHTIAQSSTMQLCHSCFLK